MEKEKGHSEKSSKWYEFWVLVTEEQCGKAETTKWARQPWMVAWQSEKWRNPWFLQVSLNVLRGLGMRVTTTVQQASTGRKPMAPLSISHTAGARCILGKNPVFETGLLWKSKTWNNHKVRESVNTLLWRETASRGSCEGMSIRCKRLKNSGSRGHHVGSFLVTDPIFYRESEHSLWFLWRLTVPWGNKISGLKEKVKEMYHEVKADEKIFLRNVTCESFEILFKDQIFELWTQRGEKYHTKSL